MIKLVKSWPLIRKYKAGLFPVGLALLCLCAGPIMAAIAYDPDFFPYEVEKLRKDRALFNDFQLFMLGWGLCFLGAAMPFLPGRIKSETGQAANCPLGVAETLDAMQTSLRAIAVPLTRPAAAQADRDKALALATEISADFNALLPLLRMRSPTPYGLYLHLPDGRGGTALHPLEQAIEKLKLA